MKIVLEIKVVEEDNIFIAFTEEPDIMSQGSSIREALEGFAIIYELETNPDFVTEVFGTEDNL